jgi:hypothetical protein
MLSCGNNQLTSLEYTPLNLEVLYCWRNQLRTLYYAPLNLKTISYTNNPIQPDWQNLSLDQIKIKNLKRLVIKINRPMIRNRDKLIYDNWVSYFDTPNDDNIAKQAILMFKRLSV